LNRGDLTDIWGGPSPLPKPPPICADAHLADNSLAAWGEPILVNNIRSIVWYSVHALAVCRGQCKLVTFNLYNINCFISTRFMLRCTRQGNGIILSITAHTSVDRRHFVSKIVSAIFLYRPARYIYNNNLCFSFYRDIVYRHEYLTKLFVYTMCIIYLSD